MEEEKKENIEFNEKKEKRILFFVLAITFSLIFVSGILVSLLKNNSEQIGEEDAKFIGNNSVLYTQYKCVHCLNQEKLFGENIKYLNIIDCFKEENRKNCSEAGIEGTPTWIIKGKKYEGYKTLNELKLIFSEK